MPTASTTNPPSISSITVTNVGGTNEILLQWTEPTNYRSGGMGDQPRAGDSVAYHLQRGGDVVRRGIAHQRSIRLFQFLDDGSLTGGWGPLKFYRLVEYPYSTPIRSR